MPSRHARNRVQARGITIWRFANGKIIEEWSEFDQLRIMQQLGLIPANK
jgi:predicted ester cyclase